MKQLSFGGEYRLVVTGPDGRVKRETDWFDNLITDAGLDRLGWTDSIAFDRARVGTGTSTPTFSQTHLDAQIAVSPAVSTSPGSAVNSGAPNYELLATYTIPFTQGSVVGNITEIGVGYDNTGPLFSRALILDVGMNPISITVTAIDQLTVYYRLKVIRPLTDFVSTVNISGTTYGYTGRVLNVGTNSFTQINAGVIYNHINSIRTYAAGATLGAITSTGLTGTGFDGGSSSATAYSTGTYKRRNTVNFSISQANHVGGMQGFFITTGYGNYKWQYHFDTPIPKDNTKTLALNFDVSWGRV